MVLWVFRFSNILELIIIMVEQSLMMIADGFWGYGTSLSSIYENTLDKRQRLFASVFTVSLMNHTYSKRV
jgi:hypothetical protein